MKIDENSYPACKSNIFHDLSWAAVENQRSSVSSTTTKKPVYWHGAKLPHELQPPTHLTFNILTCRRWTLVSMAILFITSRFSRIVTPRSVSVPICLYSKPLDPWNRIINDYFAGYTLWVYDLQIKEGKKDNCTLQKQGTCGSKDSVLPMW